MADRRTCLVCGTQFPTTREFCPVCILRGALDEGTESGESSEKMAAQAAALYFYATRSPPRLSFRSRNRRFYALNATKSVTSREKSRLCRHLWTLGIRTVQRWEATRGVSI